MEVERRLFVGHKNNWLLEGVRSLQIINVAVDILEFFTSAAIYVGWFFITLYTQHRYLMTDK